MEQIWGGLYLNSEMWECHTGQPIWHVTHWWELWGFDWVLSISFVRENTVTVFIACEPHACQAEELPAAALRNQKFVKCRLEKTNNQTEN